ncbi:hypothetical protein JCM16358_18920 [Halanaerocella petrolearia]
MKQEFKPSLSWLAFNTLTYISYWYFDLNQMIESFFQDSKLVNFPLLEHNPLFRLYLISTIIILIIGFIDTYINKQRNQIKEEKERREHRHYYSTPS